MTVADNKTWDFDDVADEYDSWVHGDCPVYARYDEVLDAVVAAARVSAGSRVLDLGTGTGNLALRCLARGAAVIGLDPSERMLANARAKTRGNPNVGFRQVDNPFLSIPYPDASFDAVVSTYAFHHVSHRVKPDAVREMLRVLRPGGMWAMGDLAFANAWEEQNALRQHDWLEDEYFIRIDEMRGLLVELGGELRAQQFTGVTWLLWAENAGRHSSGAGSCSTGASSSGCASSTG